MKPTGGPSVLDPRTTYARAGTRALERWGTQPFETGSPRFEQGSPRFERGETRQFERGETRQFLQMEDDDQAHQLASLSSQQGGGRQFNRGQTQPLDDVRVLPAARNKMFLKGKTQPFERQPTAQQLSDGSQPETGAAAANQTTGAAAGGPHPSEYFHFDRKSSAGSLHSSAASQRGAPGVGTGGGSRARVHTSYGTMSSGASGTSYTNQLDPGQLQSGHRNSTATTATIATTTSDGSGAGVPAWWRKIATQLKTSVSPKAVGSAFGLGANAHDGASQPQYGGGTSSTSPTKFETFKNRRRMRQTAVMRQTGDHQRILGGGRPTLVAGVGGGGRPTFGGGGGGMRSTMVLPTLSTAVAGYGLGPTGMGPSGGPHALAGGRPTLGGPDVVVDPSAVDPPGPGRDPKSTKDLPPVTEQNSSQAAVAKQTSKESRISRFSENSTRRSSKPQPMKQITSGGGFSGLSPDDFAYLQYNEMLDHDYSDAGLPGVQSTNIIRAAHRDEVAYCCGEYCGSHVKICFPFFSSAFTYAIIIRRLTIPLTHRISMKPIGSNSCSRQMKPIGYQWNPIDIH